MINTKFAKILLLFLFTAFISAVEINAQQFTASVDKTTVNQNEQFQIYFTFNGTDVNGLSNLRAPAFTGFLVISGPNQSSSMQIINGKVSGSVTFSYILQSQSVGSFAIGSASVDYNGKTYKTQPLTVKVERGSPKTNAANNDDQGGISNEDLAKNVFIIASADKQRVLQGEQITVTYKLYTRLNISSPQITKLPSYQGFWAEEIGTSNSIVFSIEMYKGQRYRAAVIKKVALFPTKSGTLDVTPFELNIPVIVRKKKAGNDVFDDFFNDSFFGRTETVDYDAKSNSVKIDVEPLPSQNVPAGFNGAVGNFDLKADIDKKDVQTNESISLKYTLSGTGNIKLLNLPELQLPAGMEKYDPKINETVNTKGNLVSGTKTIEYLIVPRAAGEKEIPAMQFSYFNPSSRKYVTLSAPSFKINVKKGEGTFADAGTGFSKEDIKMLNEDIRYIKTSSFDLEKAGEYSLIKEWFWAATVVPFIALVSLIGFKKRQDKLAGNVQLMRYQKAEKAAKLRLKSAKKALDASDNKSFFDEISLALFGYLEDKLGMQKSDFTLDRAVAVLQEREVDAGLIDRLKAIAEKCEFARFAPQGQSAQTTADLYDESVKVIVELDNSIALRKKKK